MQYNNLIQYGFTESHLRDCAPFPDLFPGRVLTQQRGLYTVVAEEGPLSASVSGKFSYEAASETDYPATGDFVLLERADEENAIIHRVLPRKSEFTRKAAGTSGGLQVVAANVDIVFLVMALSEDYNLRRLERYLSVAWGSGAVPVVLLTKADLADDRDARLLEIAEVSPGVDVLLTSSLTGEGMDPLLALLAGGKTGAFIGSSGAGKSTLLNRLLGDDRIRTNETRSDGKGRHTTTHRELFLLPSGGLVIDTPGMRELGVFSGDTGKAFSDIDELAAACRFSDCSHEGEPGCAVREAVRKGSLTEERLASYRKLKREMTYDGKSDRERERLKIDSMFGSVGEMKRFRRDIKKKNHRK